MCCWRAASAARNPSPRRRGRPGARPDPRLDLGGAEKGPGREASGERQPRSCRPPVRAQEAGSSARPAPQLRALQVEPSFPAERAGEGRPLPAARPPSPGCAVAPRPWLRAGGGRTRRKSCESAGSSGDRAAPGAARSRATRPQVRRVGGEGTRATPGWGTRRGPGSPWPLTPCPARRQFSLQPGGTDTFNSWRREGGTVAMPSLVSFSG